jgi:hypothetical protein
VFLQSVTAEPAEDEPALVRFLSLLEPEITRHPDRLRWISTDLVGHLPDRVGSIEVDLDDPLPDYDRVL